MRRHILCMFFVLLFTVPGVYAADSASIAPVNVTAVPPVPVGTIIPWPSGTVPTGYLECNGQSFSAASYPTLATIVGSRVPDLRGEFIRGWDHGRGVDSGRGLKSSQNDAFQGHTFSGFGGRLAFNTDAETSGIENTNSFGGHMIGTFWNGQSPPHGRSGYARITSDGYGAPRVGLETRPRNTALMYIIKAR